MRLFPGRRADSVCVSVTRTTLVSFVMNDPAVVIGELTTYFMLALTVGGGGRMYFQVDRPPVRPQHLCLLSE